MPSWDAILTIALERQKQHFDARLPDKVEQSDLDLAAHAADNLVDMLFRIREQSEEAELTISPQGPGMCWISTGDVDYSIGQKLIEVKHTDRNFMARVFRQVLMYWLLKYADSLDLPDAVWTDCLLLNPRRNAGLYFCFDEVLRSASASLNRVELVELLRCVVGQEPQRC